MSVERGSRGCRLCSSPTISVWKQHAVPTSQNRAHRSLADALSAQLGDLDLVVCTACGFLSNVAFDPSIVPYDEQYENDQSLSPVFSDHLDHVVDVALASVAGTVDAVEVGCGQGVFLRRFVNRVGARARSVTGFDPAIRSGTEISGHRLLRSMFDADAAKQLEHSPNLVVSRHTIEHVQDPLSFLRALRSAMSDDARLLLETPDVEWILRGDVLQDLFYEHCSIFSPTALRAALARSGFEVLSIEPSFGDQYLLAVAAAGRPSQAPVPLAGRATEELARSFAASAVHKRDQWVSLVNAAAERGNIVVWGAGGKGVTFVNALGDAARAIYCLIDVNPAKHGTFVARTGHPVMSWEEARTHAIGTVFITNPNYREEIRAIVGSPHVNLVEVP